MKNNSELLILENAIFDVIHSMHQNLFCKHLQNYRLGLAVLEQLNDEYNEITGQYYIPQMKTLDYYSKQWSAF